MASLSGPSLRAGVRRSAPLVPGLVPFGLVAGVAAVEAGLDPLQAVGLSVVVFAGAAQLAMIDLLSENAPLAVVVATGAVINLRMVMYSASIAPHFRDFRERVRPLCSYLLTDPAYALSLVAFEEEDVDRLPFYLGLGLSVWTVWQVSTVAGVLLGRGLPPSWGFSFAVPLVFLSLLLPAADDRPKALAAVAAGAVAVLGRDLPLNLGLPAGVLVGVVVGTAVASRAGAVEGTA